MKKILLFALLCMTLLALGSCGKKDGVYFFNFKPEIAEKYEEIARVYEKETGVPVRVVTAASGTYEQTLKSEIVKSDAPAIFQINGPVGYAAWKDYCLDLSGSELYKHLTDKTLAITDGEGVYGIPYVVEGYGIIYNEEITDKYFALTNRATSYTSMDEIRSFAALKAVVEDMTARKAELGIDGVFASTSLKSGEDWRFQTHLANVPIYYEFLDRGVDLKKPESYASVEFSYSDGYKNLFDLYINNSVTDKKLLGSKQVADSMAEFALGKCAMVQNGNWAYSQIASVSGNTVKADKVHFLPLYIGASEEEAQGLCTGTEGYFAINKNLDADKQKKALDFLTWLFTSETGKAFVTEELDFIAPFDTFDEGDKPKDPLAREVTEWLEKEEVYNIPWAFTVFPGQNFKNDFGAALLQYAQGSMSWDDVKNTFTRRWKEEAQSVLS
ncbi:MAG: ABC transporter substrate-binding protein [Ruminococcaceae bacterium]|nr:ABC transporter substrate-binding protein [Oscillospiraceae bacterium]